MAEPVFDPDGEPDLYHYWAELDYFPRDEELSEQILDREKALKTRAFSTYS